MKKNTLIVVNPQKDIVDNDMFCDKIMGSINHLLIKIKDVVVISNGTDISDKLKYKAIRIVENLKNLDKYIETENDIYITGFDGDIVKNISIDYSKKLKTHVIIDTTRFGNIQESLKQLVDNDVLIINSNDIDVFIK